MVLDLILARSLDLPHLSDPLQRLPLRLSLHQLIDGEN